MMTVHRLRLSAVLLACLALLAPWNGGLSLAAASAATPPAAKTASEAVRQAVESGGGVYAGDCVGTRSPDDLGKVCSKLVASRDTISAYEVGRTFSEFDAWLFVQQIKSGWCATAAGPLDPVGTSTEIPWPALAPGAECAPVAAPLAGRVTAQ